MEYTLFQDFAGRAQSGCTPEFGYGPLGFYKIMIKEQITFLFLIIVSLINLETKVFRR